MDCHDTELALGFAEIAAAIEETPSKWQLASDRWLDLSAACTNTSLENVVDWLSEDIRMQDSEQAKAVPARLRSRFVER